MGTKKGVHFQNEEISKPITSEKELRFEAIKKKELFVVQTPIPSGVSVKNITYDPIDIVSMLSQITVKVPLSEMFRIEEHKRRALSWLGGIHDNSVATKEPVSTM